MLLTLAWSAWSITSAQTARAADALEALPAKLASLASWDDRSRAIAEALAATTDPDAQLRLNHAAEVLGTLASVEPTAQRARVRTIAAAALDKRETMRVEASKAAALRRELPEFPGPRETWYPALPFPAPEGAGPIAIAPPNLDGVAGWADASAEAGGMLRELAKSAGWTVDDAAPVKVSGVAEAFGPARWNDAVGFEVDVHWTVTAAGAQVVDGVTHGFQVGPARLSSPSTLVGMAFDGLLADPAVNAAITGTASQPSVTVSQPAPTRIDTGELCLYRLKHADARALVVDLGGAPIAVGVATWSCAEVPAGIIAASPTGHGSVVVQPAARTIVRVEFAVEAPEACAVSAADAATFDKLVGKGKLTEVDLLPD